MEPEIFAIFLLVLIPVASLCFGLTLRLAIKPMVETLADVMRENRRASLPPTQESVELREQMHDLTLAIEDLREKVEFDRQLTDGPGSG